jgi:predicted RNase H-like HicB family nuclease
MFKHSIAVKWSDEDKGFIAFVPELEGLSAFGETQDDAVKELLIAAEGYMETLKESGHEIPVPHKMISHSGQLRLRMPKWLHAKLAMEAENEGVSLNMYLVSLLATRGERETIYAFIKNAIAPVKDDTKPIKSASADQKTAIAEIQAALNSYSAAVAESAVVGFPHEVKGEDLYAYIILKTGVEGADALKKELVAHVRKEIGPIASPGKIQFVPGLPKTRSGKIMRRILRKVASGELDQLGDTTTLADPSVVDDIVKGRQ